MELYSRVRGQGDPIVILHGLFGDGDNLTNTAVALSEQTQVHSLDARNHGRSPHSSEMNYVAMATDVLHYLDRNNIETCTLLGHSMGGKTAMRAALDYPERIKRLIVADISPISYQGHHDDIFAGLLLVSENGAASRMEADALLKEKIDDVGVRQFLLKSFYRKTNGIYDWRFNLNTIMECYQNILAGLDHTRPYEGEVLFIAGSDSDYIKPEHREHILKLFPRANLKSIVGTGHWLHAQKPDTFNNIVRRFLKLY